MPNPLKSIAVLSAHPGCAEDLKALLAGMASNCRAEPGNLRWDLWQDNSQPGRFVLDELYRDETALAAHHETPHYKNYREKIGGLAERTVMMLDAVDAV